MTVCRTFASMLLASLILASCVIYEPPPRAYYGHDGWHHHEFWRWR
ncbi:MAG TPA: hypothetical protein HPQ04_01150 [Rhodospirillaceae bacterium]|nr:hypothetical protein [Rhodospirillaceae bacterium]